MSNENTNNIQKTLESIRDDVEKALSLVAGGIDPNYHSKDLIVAKDKYDENLEDALTGIALAYKERISYIEGNKESLLIACDAIRGSIRDLCSALSRLGCHREAQNINSNLEDGVVP